MEDEEKIDPAYLKGFNEGYTIAEYMPELAEQLNRIKTDSTRMAGFKAGREQYVSERTKERLPSWLTGDRSSKESSTPVKSKDRDKTPDKD